MQMQAMNKCCFYIQKDLDHKIQADTITIALAMSEISKYILAKYSALIDMVAIRVFVSRNRITQS